MVDHEALAEALRGLGMLYGAKAGVAEAARGARDEQEAVRAYILRERPHLLASYDIEALVALVQAAMRDGAGARPSLEQFGPAR